MKKLKRKIEKYINNLSLKYKFTFIIVFVNIFLCIFIFIPGIHIIINAYTKSLYRSTADSLSYSSTEIQRTLDAAGTLADVIFSDSVIQAELSAMHDENISTANNQHYYRLYTVIQNYYLQYKQNNISSIHLYNYNFEMTSYSSSSEPIPEEIAPTLYRYAQEAGGKAVWVTEFAKEDGLFLTRSIREVEHLSLEPLGILTLKIDIDRLISAASNFHQDYNSAYYVLTDGTNLIYRPEGMSDTSVKKLSDISDDTYSIVTLERQKYFAVKGNIPNYDWEYVCLVSYADIHQTLQEAYVRCLLILGFGIFMCILFSSFLINSLTRHFNTLIDKMQSFGKSEDKIIDVGYDYSTRMDELGIIHQQFDKMACQIQDLITVNYKNELLMKEAQIKALEAQINPHFLYNTLESINWRAKALHADTISLMIESLGNLLRTTLSSKTQNYTLGMELKLIENYMTIQQIRYDDRLYYEIEIEDMLKDAFLPKLILQPLVENSIIHALEEVTEGCYIYICGHLTENNLIQLCVKNSGSQFEDNLLSKLEAGGHTPSGFGIGLLNIHHRIQLTWGNTYGLSLYNEEDFAVAEIIFPYHHI
ncbi:MAG: histidine kinase [Clostridiales bacterium]|nr:histidine kinase [Clostridiales bacterium]